MKLSNGQYMVFIFLEQVDSYNNGEIIVASTERFLDKDVPIFVTSEEYGKESHEGTIVRIKKGGW